MPHRHLVLNGFMASGKSTVGRLVAASLGVAFADLDSVIEARTGMEISRFFREHGEPEFRRVEREELLRHLAAPEASVLAVGAGALLAREARLAAMEAGVLVCLSASREERQARAASAPGSRPLFADAEHAALLLELRAGTYAEAHRTFDTNGRPPESIATDVAAFYRRNPIGVAAGVHSYSVDVGAGCARSVGAELQGATRTLVVTDSNVGPLHAARLEEALRGAGHTPARATIQAGEENKNATSLGLLWDACLASGLDRKSRLVGLGGGVVTDMTGFAAATWMRGIEWVGVPTTLLAMVDASVGGKTAIDLGAAKNCVGAFHQPRHVCCDTSYLATEPERGYRSGLAEVVKSGLIGDPELFSLCRTASERILTRDEDVVAEIVRRSVSVKAKVVSRDEREAGLRATLNLGHTVGHALEAAGGYGRLTHGEAVSLGLVAAMKLGVALGETPADLCTDVVQVLDGLGLPTTLGREDLRGAVALLGLDKKRAGATLKFVFAKGPGAVHLAPLPLTELERLVATL